MSTPTTQTKPPRVSVIVPFRNRRDLLANLLAALAAQTYDDFEVLAIDDGSVDGADMIAAEATAGGRPVRLLRSGGGGAVAARVVGVAESKSEILAFTDSDCVPDPEWLSAGVRAIDTGVDMANGFTRPTRAVAPLERSVESGTEGLYPTCNIFFRREAFDAAGGFDAGISDRLGGRRGRRALQHGFFVDTLLGWQIRRTRPWAYAPDAIVEHHVFPADPMEWIKRSSDLGSFAEVIRDVPELRETLMRGPVLFRQYTRLPIYGLAIALALRSRRAIGLSLLAWLLLQSREYRSAGAPFRAWVKVLPAKFVIDVVSSGSLAVGSARHRLLAL